MHQLVAALAREICVAPSWARVYSDAVFSKEELKCL